MQISVPQLHSLAGVRLVGVMGFPVTAIATAETSAVHFRFLEKGSK